MIDHFQTERLTASRLTTDNSPAFVNMEADPEIMKTLGGIQSNDAVKAKIQRNIDHWDQYGFGIWLFHDQAGKFVGRGGLRHLQLEGSDHIEIAYALRPEYWGKGLATEMTVKFIEIGRQLNLRELIAVTTPDNHGSRRVMEKAGLRYSGDCIHANTPCVLYRLLLS